MQLPASPPVEPSVSARVRGAGAPRVETIGKVCVEVGR